MKAHGQEHAFGRQRVSAESLAALLASEEWRPARPRSSERVRFIPERDRFEALPAGHQVSWAAVWAGEAVPLFPGLRPIGAVLGGEVE